MLNKGKDELQWQAMHYTLPLSSGQTDTIFFASAGHEKPAKSQKKPQGSEEQEDDKHMIAYAIQCQAMASDAYQRPPEYQELLPLEVPVHGSSYQAESHELHHVSCHSVSS